MRRSLRSVLVSWLAGLVLVGASASAFASDWEVKDPWGSVRRGATAQAKISRKDFGLTWNKALESGGVVVGDEVTLELEVELTKKKADR